MFLLVEKMLEIKPQLHHLIFDFFQKPFPFLNVFPPDDSGEKREDTEQNMKGLGLYQHNGHHQEGSREGQKAESNQVGQTFGKNPLLGQKENQNIGKKKKEEGGEEIYHGHGDCAGKRNPPAGETIQLTGSTAGAGRGDGGKKIIGQIGFDTIEKANLL
jgi:hypothetical protein